MASGWQERLRLGFGSGLLGMQTPKRRVHSSTTRLLKICRSSQRMNGNPSKIMSLIMKASNTETPDFRPQL